MSRFIQQSFNDKKGPKKEPKPAPKAGTKGYDYNNLADAKKIPTKGGYK